jgi:hypothetical protein
MAMLAGTVGDRAGRDQEHVGVELVRRAPVGQRDRDRVGIDEGRAPVDELDLVARDVLVDDVAEGAHDLVLAEHEVAHVEGGRLADLEAVEATLSEAREVERGLAQRLRWDRPGVDAGAAHVGRSLDEGDPLAEVGGLSRALLAGRARSDDDQVVAVHEELDQIIRADAYIAACPLTP